MINEDLESALPQSWKFETERESVFLHLDTAGYASVDTESPESPVAIVRWAQVPPVDALLWHGRRLNVRAPLLSIYFASEAGCKAFQAHGIMLGPYAAPGSISVG